MGGSVISGRQSSCPPPHPPRYPPLQIPNVAPFLAWQAGFPELGGCAEYLGSVPISPNPGDTEEKLGQPWQLEFAQFTHIPPCLLLSAPLAGFWLVTLGCPC